MCSPSPPKRGRGRASQTRPHCSWLGRRCEIAKSYILVSQPDAATVCARSQLCANIILAQPFHSAQTRPCLLLFAYVRSPSRCTVSIPFVIVSWICRPRLQHHPHLGSCRQRFPATESLPRSRPARESSTLDPCVTGRRRLRHQFLPVFVLTLLRSLYLSPFIHFNLQPPFLCIPVTQRLLLVSCCSLFPSSALHTSMCIKRLPPGRSSVMPILTTHIPINCRLVP